MDKQVKVLYVEDEPFLAKIVKESLESRDFDVQWIEDGKLVIDKLAHYAPDICIYDIMLPNVDGYQLAKETKNLHPHLPIIFLSAKSQTDDVIEGFKSGGNDYLKKPFSMEELIVRINNLLHLAASQVATESKENIEIGTYTFHPNKYELVHGTTCKKLSHREAQLLHIFLNHKNQSVDRKEILQTVWGDDSFFNSRNLDVYITKLRNYFKKDPGVQIITLKGIGYHFVVD